MYEGKRLNTGDTEYRDCKITLVILHRVEVY